MVRNKFIRWMFLARLEFVFSYRNATQVTLFGRIIIHGNAARLVVFHRQARSLQTATIRLRRDLVGRVTSCALFWCGDKRRGGDCHPARSGNPHLHRAAQLHRTIGNPQSGYISRRRNQKSCYYFIPQTCRPRTRGASNRSFFLLEYSEAVARFHLDYSDLYH